MKLVIIQCRDACGRTYYIAGSGFDNMGLNGVYCCPCCKGFNVNMLVKPTDIEEPKIKLKGGDSYYNAGVAAAMATLSRQRDQISTISQLYRNRRRDDESGEGTRTELEQPAIDGVILPREGSSQYEKEVSKYLGVPAEGDNVALPPG